MLRQAFAVAFISLAASFIFNISCVSAQDPSGKKDTFFLSKRKGLLGRLGRSMSTDGPGPDPIKIANPYMIHTGKSIRHIRILSLGFERNLYDTTSYRNSFGAIIANAFHKNTRENVILNNLFFREGNKVQPYLLADNERHLREQVYIQDARILLESVSGSTDLVDVIVITKDVFSIGASGSLAGVKRGRLAVREENFNGSGSKVAVSTFYEKTRRPKWGYGFEYIKRNIKGTFIDWKVGFQNYKAAFNSGRSEEINLYTQFEKPLVSPYIPWVGAFDFSIHKTTNAYLPDSLYKSDYKYSYVNTDGWFGYNFGSRRLMYKNVSDRVRKLIAVRAMHLRFEQMPGQSMLQYDYRYANIAAVLVAFNVFKQDFYRTNFIYGFGRNEDVAEGFSASVIGGWTKKEDRKRPYYGIDILHSHFNKKGFYSTYTLRFGGFSHDKKFEDVDLLLNVDHFTRLKKMGSKWLGRNFYSVGITKQINPRLNQPLLLKSIFGLPYYNDAFINADFRGTIKGEGVFFNMNKLWGFRFAPFIFGDMCMITPSKKSINKSELYSAWGAGIRSRNENLIFGTIELRSYYFPRPVAGMKGVKVEISSNIRFKYNSTFIKKPDFVIPN